MKTPVQIAILDDYQNVALSMADWSVLDGKVRITVFNDHIAEELSLIQRLLPFQVVCVMRERTPLTRSVLSGLPNLKLIVSTGQRNASIDSKAAAEYSIAIAPTGYVSSGAPELTWTLLMSIAKNITPENTSVRNGEWQKRIGTDITGKTIGIIGLGNIGSKVAQYARAFGMEVLAWSENLTPEKAAENGARWVTKETLFQEADFITVHLVLSARSKGIINAADFALMKPTAYFINTSRGPLVEEAALVTVLQEKRIAGAAIDVFDQEPLPEDHPFRKLDNVLVTPHIGYVTEKTYRVFYQDTVKAIHDWM